jgi:hypothetical protein
VDLNLSLNTSERLNTDVLDYSRKPLRVMKGSRARMLNSAVEEKPTPITSLVLEVRHSKHRYTKSGLAALTPSHEFALVATITFGVEIHLNNTIYAEPTTVRVIYSKFFQMAFHEESN